MPNENNRYSVRIMSDNDQYKRIRVSKGDKFFEIISNSAGTDKSIKEALHLSRLCIKILEESFQE